MLLWEKVAINMFGKKEEPRGISCVITTDSPILPFTILKRMDKKLDYWFCNTNQTEVFDCNYNELFENVVYEGD